MKLFLGAASGVGTTYEMLTDAHAKQHRGVDVVVGVAEDHDRVDTANMLIGLEIVPRRQISDHGQTLEEMDLDAILKRGPELVLVDEMEHTNVEGSLHPKRWMDVRDLLDAGIDVFATMNVEHLESTKEIVYKIAHIQVLETVPDSVLDIANDIEVVDTATEEVQQRLLDGKVVPPDGVQRALAGLYSDATLTALRELALRRAAERMDDAVGARTGVRGVSGPSGASERVLACISASPAALTVIRRAKRLADQMHAPLEVVSVAPASERAPPRERDELLTAFRLAEEMGASTRLLTGCDPAAEILAYAREQHVTYIVIGRATRPVWRELLGESITRRLLSEAGDVSIKICPRQERDAKTEFVDTRDVSLGKPGAYLVASALVALVTAFAVMINRWVQIPDIALVYVLVIIATAIRYGMAVSIFTAIASAAAYDFFLIPPLDTFAINDPLKLYALVFFIAIGLAVSGISARTRRQSLITRRQARRDEDFEHFTRGLVDLEDESDAAAIAAKTASRLLNAHVVIMMTLGEGLKPIGEAPGPEFLGGDDMAAAKWALTHGTRAGRGSDTVSHARWQFVPIPGEHRIVGAVGVRLMDEANTLNPDQRRVLAQIAAQTGIALDRARFLNEAKGERLKGTLLASVSHDLRTPLFVISGAIERLQELEGDHDPSTRKRLLDTAGGEVRQLTRFIENLLDINRIDAHAVRARGQPIEVTDLVERALHRVRVSFRDKTVSRNVSAGLPRVLVDPQLMVAALGNVLENAAKYAPDSSTVLVRAFRRDSCVAIEVVDEGEGFPAHAMGRLFGRFQRGVEGDHRPPGTGLGLAIAKGFVEAQGGSIEAVNRSDRSGAIVRMTLPIADVDA